jgi:demethoxyubiquinone hydroxylase (CLK1/Coq7/Cat5 family)
MDKVLLSLNFVYCMERFATQIYRTQCGLFKNTIYHKQLVDASANELEHVQKFQAQIKKLSGTVYPFGFPFKLAGILLGFGTRIMGKKALFKADSFVEKRAVTDYNSFIKNNKYDKNTVEIIRGIISDEEIHIHNWENAANSFSKKS